MSKRALKTITINLFFLFFYFRFSTSVEVTIKSYIDASVVDAVQLHQSTFEMHAYARNGFLNSTGMTSMHKRVKVLSLHMHDIL